MGVCSHGFVALFVTVGYLLCFMQRRRRRREKRREAKYNEKDTFIPIFNDEKREVGNRGSNRGHLR